MADFIKKNGLVIFFILLILGVYSFLFVEYQSTSIFDSKQAVVEENDILISEDKNIEEKIELDKTKKEIGDIVGFIEWTGTDPYPALDWKNTKPELKTAVLDFEEKWGKKLSIRQAYRPDGYVKHIRSVWEIWRYSNKKEYKSGYNCTNFNHIDPDSVGVLNKIQKDSINKEAKRHSFTTGDTPPACLSDHALGIAVDITPPADSKEYKKWIDTASSVGLCHYIVGDEPHFGLKKYLPKDTDCFVY